MKTVAYSETVSKALNCIPANEAKRIKAKIEQYARDPKAQANNVKKLVGSPYLRLRIGNWRVIIEPRGEVLEIMKVGSRGSIYE